MNEVAALPSSSSRPTDAESPGSDTWLDSGYSSGVLRHLSGVLWNNRNLSDVTVRALGREFHLHRLLLFQSPKFRRLLPEDSPRDCPFEVDFPVDDPFVTAVGFETALGHLYGRSPGHLSPHDTMAVLAAARCLEITELCEVCVEFVRSSLDPSNFLEYFRFAKAWETGREWAKKLEALAWAFLCRTAGAEMRSQLPGLPLDVLEDLVSADELWVQTEADRFDLAVHSLGSKLDEARDGLVEAVVKDVLDNVLSMIEGIPEWSWQDMLGNCGMGSPRLEEESDERQDWMNKGQKRGRTDVFTQPWPKKSRTQQGELMTRGSCCKTRTPSFGVETLDAMDMHSGFSDAHSDLFRTTSIGRSGHTGENRFSRLSPSAAKSVEDAAAIETVLCRVLGQQGGVLYGAMGFGDLLQVREKAQELGLAGVIEALQQGLWYKELMHSMITFAAFEDSTLKCNSNLCNAEGLRSLAKSATAGGAHIFQDTSRFPKLRYSVEFDDVEHLGRKTRSDIRSKQVFFAGSLFRVVLSVHTDKESKQKMLGVFLHRSLGFSHQLVDSSAFVDPRSEVDIHLKVIAGGTQLEVIETKGKLSPPHNNKGYSKLLHFGKLKDFLSPSGTLRVTIIVSLLFDVPEPSSGSH